MNNNISLQLRFTSHAFGLMIFMTVPWVWGGAVLAFDESSFFYICNFFSEFSDLEYISRQIFFGKTVLLCFMVCSYNYVILFIECLIYITNLQ